MTGASIDFGTHDAGQFTNQLARVHDRGYGPLQARLAVNDATITGGDGRFSIVGGFNPVLVAGTAANFQIAFDDNGASADTQYDGTLTFTNADEPLPGEADAAPLTVQLHAHMGTGTTGVPGQHLPTALRFDAPRPNPTSGYARFAFDLPRAAPVSLAIFDLAGRRVAQLASGEYGAGHYEMSWGGAGDGARPGAGLYFGVRNASLVDEGRNSLDKARIDELNAQVSDTGLAANVLFSAAAVGAVTGLILFLVD